MSDDVTDIVEQTGAPSALELSDEDFLNAPFPSAEGSEESDDDVITDEGDTDDLDEPDEEAESDDADPDGDPDSDDEGEPETSETDEDTSEVEAEDNNSDTNELDYKAEYEKLLAPFKANGRDIKVDSVDEAIQLMQMGANYNKKMSALKPNLKLLKTLENNGLLSEAKINYLIDLEKKNPEAIKQLIKESGIDPLDIDLNSDAEYTPNTYTVDDKRVELDSVLEEIKDTPVFNDTIDVISNKWDEASRQVIVDNPFVIRLINEHIQNGVYAQITGIMEKRRMLGQLEGMSDIEAYKHIGDELFAAPTPPPPAVNAPTEETPRFVKKPVSKTPDPKIADRKKAASLTKSAPAAASEEFNPLALSDDEFEKLMNKQYF